MYNDMTMYRNRNSVNIQDWYWNGYGYHNTVCLWSLMIGWTIWSLIKTEFVGNQSIGGFVDDKGNGSK